ncbi:MAG: DMT family transporter [Candidatus Rokubacteria bacterium]|nr:DMT family transporter [Candidatus Rokubacteria bacterium]
MPLPSQTRAYVALLLIVTLWGSYPATAKLALADLPPFVLVTFRCLLASVFLAVLLARRGIEEAKGLAWSDLRGLGFLAFSGIFLSTGFTYLAIYLTTASNAVILQASTPVLVALGARVYLKERLTRLQWAGIACSAAGVLLVITKGGWAALSPAALHVGDFLVLFAISGWSAYTIYGKRVLTVHSPALATTAAYVLGSLMLVPLALATVPLFPAPRLSSATAWAVVLYQALLGALAHVWWYEAVKAVGASRSAIFMNFQPVVGVLLAAAMLGERPGPAQLLGGLAVLVGVTLTTRQR